MDALGLIYYAVVCGGLVFFVDRIPSKAVRIVIGLMTGLVSASVLPLIRHLI